MSRPNQTEKEWEASLLIAQAVSELDVVFRSDMISWTDKYTNPDHAFGVRKFTMKDAKLCVKRASDLLRQAWDILDPAQ